MNDITLLHRIEYPRLVRTFGTAHFDFSTLARPNQAWKREEEEEENEFQTDSKRRAKVEKGGGRRTGRRYRQEGSRETGRHCSSRPASDGYRRHRALHAAGGEGIKRTCHTRAHVFREIRFDYEIFIFSADLSRISSSSFSTIETSRFLSRRSVHRRTNLMFRHCVHLISYLIQISYSGFE